VQVLISMACPSFKPDGKLDNLLMGLILLTGFMRERGIETDAAGMLRAFVHMRLNQPGNIDLRRIVTVKADLELSDPPVPEM
jgi:hypothetical protein